MQNLPFEQIEHQFQLNSEEIQVDPNQGLIFVPVTGKLLVCPNTGFPLFVTNIVFDTDRRGRASS